MSHDAVLYVLNGLGIRVWGHLASWDITQRQPTSFTSLGPLTEWDERIGQTFTWILGWLLIYDLLYPETSKASQRLPAARHTHPHFSPVFQRLFFRRLILSETHPREHKPSQNGLTLSLSSNAPEGRASGGRHILQRADFPREQWQLVPDGESCCNPRCEGKAELCICHTIQFCLQTHAALLELWTLCPSPLHPWWFENIQDLAVWCSVPHLVDKEACGSDGLIHWVG